MLTRSGADEEPELKEVHPENTTPRQGGDPLQAPQIRFLQEGRGVAVLRPLQGHADAAGHRLLVEEWLLLVQRLHKQHALYDARQEMVAY